VWNVANLDRKPYIPLLDNISQMMIEIGFMMRGEIIGYKGAGAGVSMAWGSLLIVTQDLPGFIRYTQPTLTNCRIDV
jgi:hypothetical protein